MKLSIAKLMHRLAPVLTPVLALFLLFMSMGGTWHIASAAPPPTLAAAKPGVDEEAERPMKKSAKDLTGKLNLNTATEEQLMMLPTVGPAKAEVEIRGKMQEVVGLHSRNIAEILLQFPEVRRLIVKGDPDRTILETLMMRVPEAIDLLVASACGVDVSDKAQREAALIKVQHFTIGEQYDIIEGMLKISFPRGMGNFLAGVQGLIEQSDAGRGRAPATRSPAPSNGASPPEETRNDAG